MSLVGSSRRILAASAWMAITATCCGAAFAPSPAVAQSPALFLGASTYFGLTGVSGADVVVPMTSTVEVSEIEPTEGTSEGGTSLRIKGTSFVTGAKVKLGSKEATSVHIVSAHELTAVTPEESAGSVSVVVSDAEGESTEGEAHYKFVAPPAPEVSELEPTEGTSEGATTVKVKGSGFVSGAKVKFGSTEGTSVHVLSEHEVTAVTPEESAGSVEVIVIDKRGTSTGGAHYKFVAPHKAEATELEPTEGTTEGGTSLKIKGVSFLTGAKVKIGATEATSVKIVSEHEITAVTPEEAEGTEKVTVSDKRGESTEGPTYRFVAPPKPEVSELEPTEGTTEGGTTLKIKGLSFLTGAKVKIGSKEATSVKVLSETELTAVTPEESEGTEKVIVSDKRGESTESGPKYFFKAPPKPEVSELEPTEGSDEGGTTVKIKGNGFLKGATVTIGGEAASVKVVSEHEITAVTPAQTAGEDPVIVTDKHGESTESGPKFTYTVPAAPTASEITPSHGSTEGGTNVVIKGTGFVAGAVVAWEGVLEFTNVVVKSEHEITATSAPFAADVTHAGNIYVYDSRGTAIGPAFTYEKPATPTVTKIEPTEGSTKGATKVTIKGSGFVTGATVHVGGAAGSVKVVNESEITAVTPAHSAGTVSVDVTDKRGTIDSEVGYKYVKPVEGAVVDVQCAGARTCRGSVSLTSAATAQVSSAARVATAAGHPTQLGSATFVIGAGRTAAVHLKLTATGRALLNSGVTDVSGALAVTGQAAKATRFTAAVELKYGGITGQATVAHAAGGARFSVGRR